MFLAEPRALQAACLAKSRVGAREARAGSVKQLAPEASKKTFLKVGPAAAERKCADAKDGVDASEEAGFTQ
ncbi:MAG TPA: hypothetical protein VFZ61_02410, partial [Polyangiales bacterium]